jgi:hypothetical protein
VDTERKRWFVCLARKAMALPIPVAIPAKSVSPKAIQREPVCMMIYLKGIELQNARRESVVLAFDLKKRVRE